MSPGAPLHDYSVPPVIYPNFRHRQSGVSTTVFRLTPMLRRRGVPVSLIGAGWPAGLEPERLGRLLTLLFSDDGPRPVWHARRNVEMVVGLLLRLAGARPALVFTSAAQRHQTGFTRFLIRHMDAVVATSRESASYLERSATVIGHGVDTSVFVPAEREKLRSGLGLDPARSHIGVFGAVRASKGVDLFIDALVSLLPARPGWQGLVVGHAEPRHRAFIEQLSARLAAAGLMGRVTFTGHVADATPFIRAVDLGVAASRTEGFGLTPLELMSCGTPVVVSRAGSFPQIVRDGETGFVVDTGDALLLERAIARLMDDPAARRRMGEAARLHVLQHHAIESEALALMRLYAALEDLPIRSFAPRPDPL